MSMGIFCFVVAETDNDLQLFSLELVERLDKCVNVDTVRGRSRFYRFAARYGAAEAVHSETEENVLATRFELKNLINCHILVYHNHYLRL